MNVLLYVSLGLNVVLGAIIFVQVRASLLIIEAFKERERPQ